MANRTQPGASSIHGTDPQNLVEKIVRSRIHASKYWNEECFGLTAKTMVDKAMELKEVGGTYGGNHKATPFLCLVLKFLQLAPEKEIAIEFMANDDFAYMRCLGAFYLRLVGKAADVYQYLEPFYNDYRKIRFRQTDGTIKVIHVDEFIDILLTEDRACDVILPRLMSRRNLEEIGALGRRVSALEELLESDDEDEESASDGDMHKNNKNTNDSGNKSRSRSNSKERPHHDRKRQINHSRSPRARGGDRARTSRSRERDRDRDRNRHSRSRERARNRHSRSRDRDRNRHSRSRERERDRDRNRHSRSRERDRDRDRDRNRHSRSRERERDSDRNRRSRSREQGRDRDRNRHSRSREREKDRDSRHQREQEKGRDLNKDQDRSLKRKHRSSDRLPFLKKHKKSPQASTEDDGGGLRDMGVDAMNKLRAGLGLAPLKS